MVAAPVVGAGVDGDAVSRSLMLLALLEEGDCMRADDMILISVDDHIAEPADMFDGHVPAKYRDVTPRVETDDQGFQQWWYGDKKGRNLGLNAVAGKPPEMYNVNPSRYARCARDATTSTSGCATCRPGEPGRAQLPQLDRVLRAGAERGPDLAVNEVMIKAYNDWHVDEWCGEYPDRFIPCGILPLFDVDKAAERGASTGGQGVPRRHLLGESGGAPYAVDPFGPLGSTVRRVLDEGTVLCLHVGSSSQAASTSPDAPPSGGHGPVVGHVHLLPGRSDVGGFLVAIPRPDVLAHRG